jgi:hypothetical protein
MAVAALVISIVALAVAGWSAWTAHRAFILERDRRHDELTPHVRVDEDRDGEGEEGLCFTNDGPLDFTSVRFRLETPLEDTPVEAFLVGSEWITGAGATITGDLGPITVGDRRFLYYRKSEDVELFPETTLRFRITCVNDRRTWSIHVEVEMSPPVLNTVW